MDAPQSPFLLLSLVGGYFFVRQFELTRFQTARESGHRLYFRSALYGALLLLFGLAITLAVKSLTGLVDATRDIADLLGGPLFLPVASYVAMMAGHPLAVWLNRFIDENEHYEAALESNDLERLIVRSMDPDEVSAIMVTLDGGKVYAGWPASNPLTSRRLANEDRRYLTLLPALSGYRDDKQKVHWETEYLDALVGTEEDGPLSHLEAEQFEITLPVNRILSIRPFDFEANEHFRKANAERPGMASTDIT